jgi:hypothetical protein
LFPYFIAVIFYFPSIPPDLGLTYKEWLNFWGIFIGSAIGGLTALYNKEVLMAILEKEGFDEFRKWLETLLDYPKEIRTLLSMEKIFECLMSYPPSNKKVDEIFDMLVFRNACFINKRDEWLAKWK